MSSGRETSGSGVVREAVSGPRVREARAGVPAREWRRRLRTSVIVVDLAGTLSVLVLAIGLGVNLVPQPWAPSASLGVGVLCAGLVVAVLAAFRCWDIGVLGAGAEEFNRIYRAVLFVVFLVALGGLALKAEGVRPWVFGVLPAIGLVLLIGRVGVRRVLHRARRQNSCMSSVLVVGSPTSASELIARARRVPHQGWIVVAACTASGSDGVEAVRIDDVPVVGDLDDVARCARDVDVVAVAPMPCWTSRHLHRLAWEIEGSGVELVVDPGLMEIGGPRLRVAPVDGLPLLRLTEPRFSGAARLLKTGFDRLLAAGLLVVLAPLLLMVAVAIRRDGGPVLYTQDRVGLGGRTFRMLKFRSMTVDADQRLDKLRAADVGTGPLFKLRADPRVTPLGSLLRRYSIDELPQLINVLTGSMSLVGPRPPLAQEVDSYADDARRRLLVRPGMTGLWQVSGRSDLSWEESVRLDLRYVENWSPALDVLVLFKTLGAVIRGRGAY